MTANCAKRWSKKRIAVLCVLGFMCIAAVVSRLTFDKIVDSIIRMELKQKLPLKKGTVAYHYWIEPPVPVAFRIFVFDIVNPKEILAGTAKPVVVEKGPYVYRMHLHKKDIKFHDNYTVEYRQPQLFIYDRESSVGPDTDTFTTVNIPFATTAHILEYYPSIVQNAADMFFRLNGEKAFMTRSVRDVWWGYTDPVLKEGADLLHTFNISSNVITGKFGFYMDRNNTDDGLWNVYSGLDDNFTNYAMIDRWNGMRYQSVWKDKHANRIKGSGDGSMQAPYITKDSKLSVFDPNMRRTLDLTFNRTSSVRGVDTLRFYILPSEFADAQENPLNAGYCTPDTGNCPPSGILNMSVVAFNAPVCSSLPHFIGGDPYLQKQVEGLEPNVDKHLPYYDYHWLTGVALSAARRYQINLKTKPYKHMEAFKIMADAYIPILWIDGVADMDNSTIGMFKHQIQDTFDAMVYVKGAIVGVACLCAFIVLLLIFIWRRKNRKTPQQSEISPATPDERSPLLNGNHHIPKENTPPDDVDSDTGNIQA